MAAHSTSSPIAPAVQADQPPTGWDAWLRQIAGSVNLLAAWATNLAAPLASPVFTGDPQAPTPPPGDNDTSISTTAFVTAAVAVEASARVAADALLAPLASPTFTGDPKAPTPATADNDTSVATTAYVQAQGYATAAATAAADNLRVLKSGDNMTGSLGIGAPSPVGKLDLVGAATAGGIVEVVRGGPNAADTTTYLLLFTDASGALFLAGITRNGASSVAYNTTSDLRLKEQIVDTDTGLEEVLRLRVRDFNFPGDRTQQGLIAQEVYAVYPDAVRVGGADPAKEPWMIEYGRLTPLLVKAVQQQQRQIERMQAEIAALR